MSAPENPPVQPLIQPPAPNPFRGQNLPGIVFHRRNDVEEDDDDIEMNVMVRIHGFYKCISGSSYVIIGINNRNYFLHPSCKPYARLHPFHRDRRYGNAAEWYVMTNPCNIGMFIVFDNTHRPKFIGNEELRLSMNTDVTVPPMTRISNGYYTFQIDSSLSAETVRRVPGISHFLLHIEPNAAPVAVVAPATVVAPAAVAAPAPVLAKRSSDAAAAENDDHDPKKLRVFLGTCSICMDSEVSHIVVPCGHACLCGGCQSRVDRRAGCPICRQKMTFITKIFSNNSE